MYIYVYTNLQGGLLAGERGLRCGLAAFGHKVTSLAVIMVRHPAISHSLLGKGRQPGVNGGAACSPGEC